MKKVSKHRNFKASTVQQKQLNQAIELGLQQLTEGKKISAETSYERLKEKIDSI